MAETNKQLTASAGGLSDAVSSMFGVAKQDQTITFGPLANKTYGDAAFAVSGTASSGLAVGFSIVSGPATISGSTVTITGAGTVTVRASQSGDANWNAATSVDQSFTVAKAALTVTADGKTRSYGAANPALTTSYSGFVNAENIGTSVHFLAVHRLTAYRERFPDQPPLPVAERAGSEVFSLPLSPAHSERDIQDAIDALRRVHASMTA